ncbi:bifunctional DNA-formamidopyrimidine glycosylase/DNA-(apurinic or apyrimidinic site) lyase [Oscillochloris sp. ZM17-4]|uniref:bifunctional DNA-formamidopyrimidine glycosylase/DNA-(apurinic or apyrimidinic site) lyase n=1 Tax=Oscillochloris sp. ZM17-4 TaxID=2866714 RepID=UPI001C72BA28|nr:bifunctional DNA-formamidopyrimidine glycosylase/DNA-(apurinic or apyrimidinic site) lyase [Oscillochloris sp. ZM17-4]MBX0328767.1 bifunctional DNA-formamidopyrimidine glycosylase/DNA-(apurinic or apyrimidinic site) lyase [Oscillochloris sp. ZM17-4]
MPELPEVETVARSLAPQVVGRRIAAIEKLDWERMVETPDLPDFRALIVGREVLAVGRRAKWLLATLDAGWTLAVHLRMSGNLIVRGPEGAPDAHTHLVLALDDGRRIFFEDQRKFGRVRLLGPDGLALLDAAHGPEPLGDTFSAEHLGRILAGRRTKLKPLLLDQAAIAGIGNIYASEALWMARLHPLIPAGDTPPERVPALHAAIRQVLEEAIANQGSSLRNYRNSYGERGQNQDHFRVYDREGQPCERCGEPITRVVIAQRSTFYCPSCQRLPSDG